MIILRIILRTIQILKYRLDDIRTAWETPEVSIWTNRRLIRRKGSCSRTFDFIGGNMSGLAMLRGAHGIPGTPAIGCCARGTCSISSPRGMCPGWEGFIHIAKPSLIVGAERRDKAKAGDWSAVRTSALHCTTQMATKSGAGERRRIETQKVSPHEGAICRHCIAIDLALHSFADVSRKRFAWFVL